MTRSIFPGATGVPGEAYIEGRVATLTVELHERKFDDVALYASELLGLYGIVRRLKELADLEVRRREHRIDLLVTPPARFDP